MQRIYCAISRAAMAIEYSRSQLASRLLCSLLHRIHWINMVLHSLIVMVVFRIRSSECCLLILSLRSGRAHFALYFRDMESLLHSIWWFICKCASSIFILCSWCSFQLVFFTLLAIFSLLGSFVISLYLFVANNRLLHLSYGLVWLCVGCCVYQSLCCLFVSATQNDEKYREMRERKRSEHKHWMSKRGSKRSEERATVKLCSRIDQLIRLL